LFFRDDAAGEQPDVADAQGVIDRHVPGALRIRGRREPRRCEPPDAARLAEHLALLG
jgi:hypothetical protein